MYYYIMPRKSRSTKSKKMRGGRVVFPSEYYGVASGRYHDAGSPNLQACTNAYGQALARSFGTGNLSDGFVGPNLAPSPSSSFVQTAGAPKKSNKSNKSKKRVRFRSRSQSPRNRSRSQVRRRSPTPPPKRRRGNRSRSRSRSPKGNKNQSRR